MIPKVMNKTNQIANQKNKNKKNTQKNETNKKQNKPRNPKQNKSILMQCLTEKYVKCGGSGFSRSCVQLLCEGTPMHARSPGDCYQDEEVAWAWQLPEPWGEAWPSALGSRKGGWGSEWSQKLKAKFWGRQGESRRENGRGGAKPRVNGESPRGEGIRRESEKVLRWGWRFWEGKVGSPPKKQHLCLQSMDK